MSLRGRWEGLRLEADAILRRAGPAFTKWARAVGPRLAQTAHDWGPRLERMGWALVELTAGPKRAMRQLALAVCLQCGVVAWHVLRKGRTSRRSKEEQSLVDALARAPTQDAWGRAAAALDAADGSDAWRARGGSGEKLLDAKRLAEATQRLAQIPRGRRGGVHGAMYALRGGALLSRGAHGLLEPRLHARARAGGPALVEAYLTAATAALEYVATAQDPTVPIDARLAFFNECRHAHGRTALLLSGGAGMGIYHLGVVHALRRAGLLPRVVSGASAGSIVASLLCCRDDKEIEELYEAVKRQRGRNLDDEAIDELASDKVAVYFGEAHPTVNLPRTTSRETFRKLEQKAHTVYRLDFFRWRSAASLRDDLLAGLRGRRLREPAVMNGDHLAEVIRADVGGDVTFQEAFDKTGRILNIPVKAIDQIDDTRKVHVRMLNYLTAPHVVVWSASRASCSVPGVYAPFPLLARDPDGSLRYEGQDSHDDHFEPTLYVDGSMGADLPIETMKAMFNCDHFICSQVNAHAAILGDSALRLTGAEAPGVLEDRVSLRTCRETPGVEDAALAGLAFLKHQLKAWVAAGARFCATLQLGRAATAIGADLIPWQLGGWGLALLTQPYEGRPEDVTIVPWAGHLSLFGSVLSSLTNATGDGALRLEAVLDAGERNTWRELPKIRDHCAVEVALETGVQRLRRSLLAARRSGSPQTASLGRTPSFYTSPSLLQLSGLNVVDPALNRSADPDSPPSSGEDGFVEVPKQRPRSQSESGPILKSMHMANFYYRHSNRSSRSLNSQRSVSEQSSLDNYF